jgi:hypothetical protein
MQVAPDSGRPFFFQALENTAKKFPMIGKFIVGDLSPMYLEHSNAPRAVRTRRLLTKPQAKEKQQ